MDPIHLKHFGKKEILKKIDLMEPEFDVPMAFDDSKVPNQPANVGADAVSWGVWSASIWCSQVTLQEEGDTVPHCRHVWVFL